jgi:hypothetical protein
VLWEGSSLELSPGKLDTDLLSKRSPENRAAISIRSARPPIITVIGGWTIFGQQTTNLFRLIAVVVGGNHDAVDATGLSDLSGRHVVTCGYRPFLRAARIGTALPDLTLHNKNRLHKNSGVCTKRG